MLLGQVIQEGLAVSDDPGELVEIRLVLPRAVHAPVAGCVSQALPAATRVVGVQRPAQAPGSRIRKPMA